MAGSCLALLIVGDLRSPSCFPSVHFKVFGGIIHKESKLKPHLLRSDVQLGVSSVQLFQREGHAYHKSILSDLSIAIR